MTDTEPEVPVAGKARVVARDAGEKPGVLKRAWLMIGDIIDVVRGRKQSGGELADAWAEAEKAKLEKQAAESRALTALVNKGVDALEDQKRERVIQAKILTDAEVDEAEKDAGRAQIRELEEAKALLEQRLQQLRLTHGGDFDATVEQLPVEGVVDQNREELLSWRIDSLELSTRLTHCLRSEGVSTLRELVSMTESDLLNIRHFNRTCLDEVKIVLAAKGLSLASSGETEEGS